MGLKGPGVSTGSGERIDVPIDKLTEIRSRLLDAGSLVGFNLDVENGQAWVIVRGDSNTSVEGITAV